ncbi:MAG: hypothetical protein ABSB52_11360 [Acidimicrobiales bacterium]
MTATWALALAVSDPARILPTSGSSLIATLPAGASSDDRVPDPTNTQERRSSQRTGAASREAPLRGLLVEAYDFWVFGQIVVWAGIAAFMLAGLMILLAGLGLWHARRVSDSEQILATPFDARLTSVESQGGTAHHHGSQLRIHLR